MRSRTARIRLNRGRAVAYFMDADDTRGELIVETEAGEVYCEPRNPGSNRNRRETDTSRIRAWHRFTRYQPTASNPGVQKGFLPSLAVRGSSRRPRGRGLTGSSGTRRSSANRRGTSQTSASRTSPGETDSLIETLKS